MHAYKPSLTLRKVDESEFINVRTYWALVQSIPDRSSYAPNTYELRINHAFPEDEFAFFAYEHGDCYELVTDDEREQRRQSIVEHEPQLCDACSAADDGGPDDCTDCRAASLNHADAILDTKLRVMTNGEKRLHDELRVYWSSLLLFVQPVINTCATGWRTARL